MVTALAPTRLITESARPRAVESCPRHAVAGVPGKEQKKTMSKIMPILMVSDMQRSIDFYTGVLGFTLDFTMPGENGALLHASVSRGDAHLMFSPLFGETVEHRDLLGKGVTLYVSLDRDVDIDAIYFGAKAAGAKIAQEPTDQFWGDRDWGLTDPDGYSVFISKTVRDVSPEEMLAHAGEVAEYVAGAPAD
jgi:uncharacterized glyoxalase superfamily protein PhnB